jgi:hypothetical protein
MAGGVEVRVTGANQLKSLARDLKEAGGPARGLRRELLAAMRLAGKPMVEAAKTSARLNLPRAGGLNVWVADGAKIAVRNRVAATNTVGMRIVATEGGARLEDMDNGKVRHPTFGRRGKGEWFDEDIRPGWFTKPLNEHAPQVQADVIFAMNIIGRRIEKGIF